MSALRKPDFRNLKVLVVDDSAFILRLVSQILKSFGVGTVARASSGNEGYEVAQQFEPDIVISDWDMPDGTGIDLVRNLRSREDSKCKYTSFIMLTAYAEISRVLASRDLGISEFLTKPVSPSQIYTRLVSLIEHPRQFVATEGDYFGPDRRRLESSNYKGEDRRIEDPLLTV